MATITTETEILRHEVDHLRAILGTLIVWMPQDFGLVNQQKLLDMLDRPYVGDKFTHPPIQPTLPPEDEHTVPFD